MTSRPDAAAVRTEKDSFGPIDVPAQRLWGAQTQRSLQHFDISGERMAPELIRALAQVKRASAYVNNALGLLDTVKTTAIVAAADEVIAGGHLQEFPLVVWQTGSGTQTNMNMNEVLANRASELLGGPRGEARLVHPNDDVNKSQSSNDVFPTAMHLAAVDALMHRLLPALQQLRGTLAAKASAFDGIVKIGRTHLQDATPLTLGQEITGWVAQPKHGEQHVRAALDIPVVGTVPAIKPAALASKTRVFGVLGTAATVRQPYVARLAAEHGADCIMQRHGSAALVELAEAKLRGEPLDPAIARTALAGLTEQPGGDRMDVVALACTHFPLVEAELAAAAPRPLAFVHGGDGIARRIAFLTQGQSWPDTPPPGIAVFTRVDDKVRALVPALARYGLSRLEQL